MLASTFIAEVAKRHNVTFTVADGCLRVRGIKNCPQGLRTSIVGHQHNLLRYLVDKDDRELERTLKNDEDLEQQMARLGFVRMLVGQTFREHELIEEYRYAHLNGDEIGDAILCGLLDPADAEADVKKKDEQSREMVYAAAHPPRGRIFGHWLGRIPGL